MTTKTHPATCPDCDALVEGCCAECGCCPACGPCHCEVEPETGTAEEATTQILVGSIALDTGDGQPRRGDITWSKGFLWCEGERAIDSACERSEAAEVAAERWGLHPGEQRDAWDLQLAGYDPEPETDRAEEDEPEVGICGECRAPGCQALATDRGYCRSCAFDELD